ncbi:MAG: hypothetical protein ABS81_03470 [Pseudonocardia sp. SCN 72-86]|nr:MAG: hypothetical protein ABS81_03470 [Pseudonocardia sp. SCN 72-86]
MSGAPGVREFSGTPLTGYKIAFPMISADGARTAFSGLAVGRKHVYLAVDKAVCLNNSRHPVPYRMCKCGFYSFHTLEAARDLTCTPENRDTVVLEVAASGRYRRHELGLRYEAQHVRHVWTGRCRCGRAADVFVDSGHGRNGWRQLTPCCTHCSDRRPVLTLEKFAALTGEGGIDVRVDHAPLSNFLTPDRPPVDYGQQHRVSTPVVDAELAVINARIDELQSHIDRLLHRD